MLEPDGEPHIIVGDAGAQAILGRKLRMRRRGRVDREAADIADIGDVVEELQRIDEGTPRREPTLQLETDEPAIATLQILVRAPPRFALLVGRMDDARDGFV